MVDFGESDKMIKINGKVDKSDTTGLLVIFRSLFTELRQTKYFSKENKCFVQRSSVNKEWNITSKPVVSVWFIYFSTYFYYLSFYYKRFG